MLNDLLLIGESAVSSILAGRESELMDTVRAAYETHARGLSSLTHSTFLRFPEAPGNRIIALPAYLGGEFEVAGIKWISSFPGNHDLGMERASAVVILNSTLTGRPTAILEGGVISAKRTAASAALAARHLHDLKEGAPAGLIGCGLINFEIMRFLRAAFPGLKDFVVFDLDAARAARFRDRCQEEFVGVNVAVVDETKDVLRRAPLVSLATTALKPHIEDLSECAPGSTILHVSLRDITAEAILGCDNVTDDIDHACRAETSLHLAERRTGGRGFIRCTLADILLGHAPARREAGGVAVFSPFGLGVLDVAVAKLVYDAAREQGVGVVDSFLPAAVTPTALRALESR
ncbi:MAG TPA: 2,3-diaminopropionate biosynthesis protein SbnB [Pyrinomonadaceae bacterium]|jgi:ornithine cyclodeaminase|nr:2,3-diaminopropionate biosynthesis protein SbnB [Pyrinomonadaceae bacterium]